MKIGYICVTTEDECITRQQMLLELSGVGGLYIDKCYENSPRLERDRMMEFVKEGDTIVVETKGRLASCKNELARLIGELIYKRVQLVSIMD